MKYLLTTFFIVGWVFTSFGQINPNPNTLPNTSPWPTSGPASIGVSSPTTISQFEVKSDITLIDNGGLGTTPLTLIGYASAEISSNDDAEIFDVRFSSTTSGTGSSVFSVSQGRVDVSSFATLHIHRTFLNNEKLFLRSSPDQNHFLGFSSSFGGASLDGPVLAGFSSGILGTTANGNNMALFWNYEGKVGIGTTSIVGPHKLYVAGSILAEEVVVKLQANWPDYVFDDNYKLTSLNELDSYIKKEGHLPNVPSAKTISEEGIKVAEMNAILLEKIEELTLHLIQLNQEIEILKKEK